MARTPRARIQQIEPDLGPLEEAVLADQANIADDLSNIFDALKDYDSGTIKGILYRKPLNGIGKYEWIEETVPPFDLSAIHNELKERFGGGSFQLRVFAGGRIRKNVDIDIVKEKTPIIAPQKDGGDMMMMFQIMMQTQAANQQAAQVSADRQMQMMMAANQQSSQMMMGMMTAIVPALAGGREKTSDLMQAIAAMQPKGESAKETLELMASMKTLLKDDSEKGSGGFDADDLVGSVVRMAGPVAGAVGRVFSERRGAAENPISAQQVEYAPQPSLMLGNDAPNDIYAPAPQGARHPVLALIRDDVLFMFTRNHDPERAADIVYDTIEANGVTEEQINDLVGAFALSTDWLGELAAEGIDLRTNPEWANQFLSALVSIHTDPERNGNDFGGQGGSNPNLGPDGEPGPQG